MSGVRSVNNIDFRRAGDGSARVIVELTDSKVPADLRQEGGKIVVNFAKTAIPENLLQRAGRGRLRHAGEQRRCPARR